MPEKLPLYLDYHATTPVDSRVLDAMLPYFTECFGNASSVDHEAGAVAQRAVEAARAQVAEALNASSAEIIFTSGATEANNLAILGVAEAYADKGRHIITCSTEHPAVLDPCRYLERHGSRVTVLPVDSQGVVDLDALRAAITTDTILVSIMAANNEVGTLAPLADIATIAKEHGILLHTDATQAIGRIPIDVDALGIDLLSLSAHKLYGPKGVGALYVRRKHPRVKVSPQLHGGSHERGLRSGTLNVPSIVGMGVATELSMKELNAESVRTRGLRDRLWSALVTKIEGLVLNGHPTERLPNNLNLSIDGVDAKALLIQLRHELCLSAGSACATTKVEPSHVLLAMGLPKRRVFETVRLGLGRSTSEADIDFAAERIAKAIERIRSIAHTSGANNAP